MFKALLSIVLFIVFSSNLYAESKENKPELLAGPISVEQKLLNINQSIADKKKDKALLEKNFKNASSILQEAQLTQEISAVNDIIDSLEAEFISDATGQAKLYATPKAKDTEFNWRKDLEMIAEPLLSQMRDLSKRPRKIERLEADITLWKLRVKELEKAVKNLEQNSETVSNKALNKQLKKLLSSAQSRLGSAEQKLDILQSKLQKVLKTDNPLWQELGNVVRTTVLSMFLHLLLAFVGAVLMFQIVGFLAKIPIWILHKKRPGQFVLTERVISLVKRFASIILATMVYLIVLYSFSEWLLLVVSVAVVFAALISLKDAIPRYLVEIRTMLNLGSVRQGEVIQFNQVNWLINNLDIYTDLYNPALDTHLRVPITHIADLYSRAVKKEEPWFPSNVGDTVIMDDGAFGKVKQQTPDNVIINFGDSTYHYTTAEFLGKRPRNLSSGFTVLETFGIDYDKQATVTGETKSAFKQFILSALKNSPYNEHKTFFDVEFEMAAASSLDYKIIVSFTGAVAQDFYRIKRFLQSASVDAANEYNLGIPFQQITVHQAQASIDKPK